MEDRWLDVDGVVTYLKLKNRRSVYNRVARRTLPFTRMGAGGALRFDKRELDKMLAAQTVGSI